MKKGRFAKKGAGAKKEGKAKKAIAQPTYKLSKELAAIVNAEEMSRPEVTKQLWVYIKAQGLQDPKNKRMIIPDSKLAKVIGKEPIDMMKLSSFLTKHLKK